MDYLLNWHFDDEDIAYLRSLQLSKEFGLYRQDFCGCVFSKLAREKQKEIAQARRAKEAQP